MMITLFFVLCLVTSSTAHTVDDMHSMLKEDLELERQLNLINKSSIKSIQTMSGYIIDCVDINNQPAFSHPLLKKHKLQRKPSFEKLDRETSVNISSTKPIHVLEKVSCPKETVPIRRITKDDLSRGKSLFNDHILTQNNIRTYYAELFAIAPNGPYFGVSGTTSIYNPKVINGQTSASHIYVENGKGDGNNKITVGWHVSPQLYKNDATHFYSTWTSQNYKNGCYNMLCPGFVQTNRAYYLGSRIAKTSSTSDRTKVEMPISLLQDEKTKNWWLLVQETPIGYFPAHLFSNLVAANTVGWGGLAATPAGTSPPMGSGLFPDKSYIHSCYFRYISYKDNDGKRVGPAEYLTRKTLNAPGKCYAINYYEYDGKEAGYALEFGGPGGYCGN
ncbi:hypothetical protein P8452_41449 [Trifolium repens]|nr:hypothetical protein P8452_41449 [Trifolium repens]